MKQQRRTLTTARALALVLPLAGLLAAAPADAKPSRTEGAPEVIGECAPGDELVGRLSISESGRTRANGTETLHLRLTGTITRTGTGVVGRYSERQNDTFRPDGSERYVGVLSQLVVPGGGGYTWAGQASLPVDGDPRVTHGLAPLLESDFVAVVCEALAR